MESIPNKIADAMGMVADVNLLYENDLQYIEIIVDKSLSLISYHGKYFYRSGSTMRTITGKERMIEAWGRGVDKIKETCAKYDGHLPEYNISVSGIMVLCKVCDKYLDLLNEETHLGQSD